MTRTLSLSKKHQHQLAVIVMLWMGSNSLGRFPGISGWLGCAGWLVLAVTLFLTPSLLTTGKIGSTPHRGVTVIAVGTSLALMVAGVVVWSTTRH